MTTPLSEEPRINLRKYLPQPEALQLIPEPIARKYSIMPLAVYDGTLQVAMANPADVNSLDALATKIVSVYKHNPEKYKMPTILAKIMVQDINTGEIVGIMDGGLITAMRTGAATGVSVKYLARKESKTMGIVGAGVQASNQIWTG